MNTIAAISTAPGKGGIGIIRMSGKECFEILDKIFIPKKKDDIKGYKMKYGQIVDSRGNVIDEVLVSYFVNPNSYTRENMCEINSHGGFAVEKAILQECIENGAILAEPGEFTKRAFLNGRIDLSQAEAVIDVINAKTESERNASVKQLEGVLSKRIKKIQKEILDLIANIEVSIDYPEYDVEKTTNLKILKVLNSVNDKLEKLSISYKNGKIVKNGIQTAIVGKPNVGKSSLLNLMLNEERAIVSDIEGTTRDTIEECIDVGGIQLKIIDTAGIRNTNDEIEKIGVKKSIDIIDQAELIIALFDDSRALEEEDIKILNLIENKNTIILVNKVDLGMKKIDINEIEKRGKKIIKFSTQNEDGLNILYEEIIKMFNIDNINNENGEMITNIRQKQHIDKCISIISEIKKSLEEANPIDIVAIQIKEILEELGNITGDNVTEDIINEIFSKFCLGK